MQEAQHRQDNLEGGQVQKARKQIKGPAQQRTQAQIIECSILRHSPDSVAIRREEDMAENAEHEPKRIPAEFQSAPRLGAWVFLLEPNVSDQDVGKGLHRGWQAPQPTPQLHEKMKLPPRIDLSLFQMGRRGSVSPGRNVSEE